MRAGGDFLLAVRGMRVGKDCSMGHASAKAEEMCL